MNFHRCRVSSGLLLMSLFLLFGSSLDVHASDDQPGIFSPSKPGGLLPDGTRVSPGVILDSEAPVRTEPSEKSDRNWTFLFYNCADFSPGGDAMSLFLPEMYSTETIDVLVLLDPYNGPAQLLHVPAANTTTVLENWGEVDMGSPATIQQFIEYGKTNYPADRYILAGYGHGSHYAGVCVDYNVPDGSGNSIMSWEGFRSGIAAAGGLDILAFTAPCTVTPLEGMAQLQDSVDVLIGSEDLSFYAIWYGIMDDVRIMLSSDQWPTPSTRMVAETMVNLVGGNTEWFDENHTIDAIDPLLAGAIVPPMDDLATYLMNNMARLHGDIIQARADCYELSNHYYEDYTGVDLISLLEQLAIHIPEPTVLQATSEAIAAAETATIAVANGADQTEAHGISIYFPQTESAYHEYYSTCDLTFITDTAWHDFLLCYFAGSSPSGVPDAISREGLLPNWPNPFNPSTNISFKLETAGQVDLQVHDVTGRRIRTLAVGRTFDTGHNNIRWDGLDDQGHGVASGVYFVRLLTENDRYLRKIMMVK